MKIFAMMLAALVLLTASVSAAKIENGAEVAVMDFGTHPRAVTIDINILNAGEAAHEYILQRIFESGKLEVMDRFLVEEKIAAENLNTTGIIDPDTAQELGKILGAKYIIYGNVNDVTLSEVGTKIGIGGCYRMHRPGAHNRAGHEC